MKKGDEDVLCDAGRDAQQGGDRLPRHREQACRNVDAEGPQEPLRPGDPGSDGRVQGESLEGRHPPTPTGRLEELVGVGGLPCQEGDETGRGEDEDQDNEDGHDRRGQPVPSPKPEEESLVKGVRGDPDDRRPDQGNAEGGQDPVEQVKEKEGKGVGDQGPEHSPVHGGYFIALEASLPSSRSHRTELATAAHRSQSPALKLTVEKACCRNGA